MMKLHERAGNVWKGRMEGAVGEAAGWARPFYTALKQRRASARALPDQVAAKPKGVNRTTEITIFI